MKTLIDKVQSTLNSDCRAHERGFVGEDGGKVEVLSIDYQPNGRVLFGVDIVITEHDAALAFEDFNSRILHPAMAALTSRIARAA